jgi:hypothetical protein
MKKAPDRHGKDDQEPSASMRFGRIHDHPGGPHRLIMQVCLTQDISLVKRFVHNVAGQMGGWEDRKRKGGFFRYTLNLGSNPLVQRTIKTPQGAWRLTFSAVVPQKAAQTPESPLWPTSIRSNFPSLAICTIVLAGCPGRIMILRSIPASCAWARAASKRLPSHRRPARFSYTFCTPNCHFLRQSQAALRS